jgi:hypothetical protein
MKRSQSNPMMCFDIVNAKIPGSVTDRQCHISFLIILIPYYTLTENTIYSQFLITMYMLLNSLLCNFGSQTLPLLLLE